MVNSDFNRLFYRVLINYGPDSARSCDLNPLLIPHGLDIRVLLASVIQFMKQTHNSCVTLPYSVLAVPIKIQPVQTRLVNMLFGAWFGSPENPMGLDFAAV